MKTTKNEKIEILRELKRDLKNKKILASVSYVSPSGMSRRIKFFYMGKNGYIYNISYKIAQVLEYRYNYNDNALVVGGCGMDMIFYCLYNLNSYAIRYGIVKKSKNKSQHDLHYNGLVDTHYQYL